MVDQAERLREIFQGRQTYNAPKRRGLSRIIVVASGKGGVGKTNLVVNLAIVLGQWGHKIVILDTDLGLANVDILLDLKPEYSLLDVIRGYKDLSDVVLRGPFNVEVIPGGSGFSEVVTLDNHQREQLVSRLSYIEENGDILLIDCAAGLSRNVLSFIAAADELIMVTTPEPTAITDVYSIIKVVNNYRLHSAVNLVVNMTRSPKEGENVYKRIQKVCENFLEIDLNFLGDIEFDHSVHQAVVNCLPYVLQFPRSRAAQCTRQIARRILFEEEMVPEEEKKKEGGFLKRLIKLWS
ncbi:MAG: MinD/ParA family protein [Bacillota bacterium]|nr:MinD/ParA family protein [Bacillota bacterium]